MELADQIGSVVGAAATVLALLLAWTHARERTRSEALLSETFETIRVMAQNQPPPPPRPAPPARTYAEADARKYDMLAELGQLQPASPLAEHVARRREQGNPSAFESLAPGGQAVIAEFARMLAAGAEQTSTRPARREATPRPSPVSRSERIQRAQRERREKAVAAAAERQTETLERVAEILGEGEARERRAEARAIAAENESRTDRRRARRDLWVLGLLGAAIGLSQYYDDAARLLTSLS